MRKILLVGWAVAMVAAFCACDMFGDRSTNVIVTQGQGQGTGTPSPSPQLPGVCPPVVGLNAHALDSGVQPAGTVVTLDATPQFAFELSPEEHKRCSLLAGITWTQPAAPCSLSSGNGPFNPLMTRDTAGTCSTTPTCAGIQGPEVLVTFQ